MIAEDVRLLTTSDGARLRAGVRRPRDARRSAVLCHPHPDYGGSMHTTLIAVLSQALAGDGLCAVRFDFRRPGTIAERRLDVAAAIAEAGGDRVLLAGWSYGGDLALAVASADGRVAGVVAVAPPLMAVSPDELAALAARGTPALALVPEHDQFAEPHTVAHRLDGIPVEVLDDTDHFCSGAEDAVARYVLAFERSLP